MSKEAQESMGKLRTAWHPPFVRVLRIVLPAQSCDVLGEYLLSAQPQRIDVVVVRKTGHPGPIDVPEMRPLCQHLGQHTLIELTGPTSTLGQEEFLWLEGYTYQYCAQNKLFDRSLVHRIVVANRLTPAYRDLAKHYGARIRHLSPGVWLFKGLAHRLYFIETEKSSDHVLHLFSRQFLQDPQKVLAALQLKDERQQAIVSAILDEVKQLKADPLARYRYSDYEVFAMSMEEFIDDVIKKFPDRFTPEQMLKRLTLEERLKGLTPEERLKGLPAEDRLKGMSDEDRQQLKELLLKS